MLCLWKLFCIIKPKWRQRDGGETKEPLPFVMSVCTQVKKLTGFQECERCHWQYIMTEDLHSLILSLTIALPFNIYPDRRLTSLQITKVILVTTWVWQIEETMLWNRDELTSYLVFDDMHLLLVHSSYHQANVHRFSPLCVT